jgi:hypothetical protein
MSCSCNLLFKMSAGMKLGLQWNWVLWSIVLRRVTSLVLMKHLKVTCFFWIFCNCEFRLTCINYIYIECSFCRLIRYLGSFLESLIGRQCGSPRQTEAHSFGDHLISAVLRHQVLQKLPALCSVLCLYGSCETQFRTKSFHLWLICEKLIQIMQKKILR